VAGPFEYEAAGFRILPIANDGSKKPLVEGFGKDAPDFTIPAAQFLDSDAVAILTGPCPGFGSDWLCVLDLDGETTLDQVNDFVGGEPLPETLSSKNYSHFYFRVPDSDIRAAIRQWVRVFGRADGAPELDLKWAGGYAIEPRREDNWDEGFDPARIAVLPESWIRRVLELRNANPYAAPSAPAHVPGAAATRVYMGDVPMALANELGAVWPQPGQGCHEAALALGGILGDSWWSEDDIARFACAVFAASGTKNRVPDVLHSVGTKRAGGECKGWPSLKACLKDCDRGDYQAALKALKLGVPGLSAPKVNVPDLTAAGKVNVTGPKAQLQLNIGSDDEIATCVIRDHLPEAVFDEGAIWNFDAASGTWAKVETHTTSAWIEVYDGVVYDFSDKGKPIWVKLGAGRVTSIQRRIEAKRAQPGYFASAPVGLAFQNGFLRLDGPVRTFEALSPDHKARHLLPCAYEPDAARRAPPRAWARYLKSIWGSDVQAIELVHQILGYLLSGRHDLQKIFVLLGPPRAGKGTLLNVIQAIFRDQATSFKVANLDGNFSMQSMLGKSVAYDPDVRRANSMFKSEGQMVERLLSISSHDTQVIPRKNLQDVVVALPARLLLAANPPFGLTDVGGALASRFIILTFPKSFLGSEDTGLGEALTEEIPAIVALALDGLDRLNAVGRFVEPASSAEERESVERAQNPMLAFVSDECETGKDFSVGCAELWVAAVKWRDENGHKRMSSTAFSEFLRQRGVHQVRPQHAGERQPRTYVGIRLLGKPNVKPYMVADPARPIGTTKT
jgi:P4 family phage/plasmid primase-like protien